MKNVRIRLVAVSIFFAALACAPEHRGNTFTEPPPPKDASTLTSLDVSFQGALVVGQSAAATVTATDQFGATMAAGPVVWSTLAPTIATVNGNGVVTAVAIGQTQVVAAANGIQAQASITVVPIPVASVAVTPTPVSLVAGNTQQLTVVTRDVASNVLTGRVVTWTSSDQSKATVDANGLVTAVAAGSAIITATSEGKTGGAQIIVTPSCTSANALQLSVGGMHTLTGAEKAFLCLGSGASASEYALIPFNSTPVAASAVQVQITGTNTSAIQPGSLFSIQTNRVIGLRQNTKKPLVKSFEWSFRERERRDLASAFASVRVLPRPMSAPLGPRFLTNIPANPIVGTVVQINGNLSGNACTAPKVLRGATVIAVLNKTIVLSDVTSPAGGFTNQEMIDFGTAFDTLGYGLDTLNFGNPTDIDANGRVAILFTPSVNSIPAPPGAVVGGLFAGRDLEPVATCVASNEGEMFYMPVPDPNKTINGNYADKTEVGRAILPTLVHEFQHLINAGRRQYINHAPAEEIWLNEGLSHIAEELLYYRMSGNTPGSNIDLSVIQSSQAQIDAINTYQFDNLVRAGLYMKAPETNSPYGQVDLLEMRGAIWQLLRYSADRKGGVESATWQALVNSTASGQANFNAVFGNIITNARDWAVAQFADDAGLGLAANFTNPSWNFRSVLPVIFPPYPLLTHPLLATPVTLTLYGGGAGYLRFSVAANTPAIISGTSSGQAVPSAVDFILLRTQ